MNYIIMNLLLLLLLACLALGNPISDLQVTPTTYTIQEPADYTFLLTFNGDGFNNYTVPVGSSLIIYFPQEYPLLPAQNHVCAIVTWPTSYSPITCSLAYQTLTITNAFTTSLVIDRFASLTLKWIVHGVQNPTYAQTTTAFSGVFQFNNSNVFGSFAPNTGLGITITPGNLVTTMAVDPTTADSTSNLSLTVSPSHSIPVGGYLKITFSSSWSTSIYQNTILNAQSACLGINNTAPNLGCTYVLALPNLVLSVVNIFSNQSSSSFTFNITNFLNPPTTQPVGDFLLQTFNTTDANAALIDQSSGNLLQGITATPILNPKLYLSQYNLGLTVEANLTVTITNVIATTDTIYIESPVQIDLSVATAVLIASVQSNTVSVHSPTLISFNPKFQLSNPFPVNITINQLKLAPYAATITSPFQVYVKRNTYFICHISHSFNIALSPGSLTVVLGSSSLVAGLSATYNFSLTLSHGVTSVSKIGFYFSSTFFSIGSGVTCQSSLSTNCNILTNSNNLIEVSSITVTASNQIDIILMGILNPSAVGPFTPISISTYTQVNGVYYLVDTNQVDAILSLQARPMALSDLTISSSSYEVYASANYTITVKNNNNVEVGSTITIYVPTEITYASIACSVVCVSGTFNGTQGIQLQQIGPLSAGTTSTFTIQNMVNPLSTRPSSPFQLDLYNSNNNLLEYLHSGPSFRATTPSSMSMTVLSSSSHNSAPSTYSLTYSTSYSIPSSVALVLVVPKEQTCPLCVAQQFNSSHNQFIFYNQTMNGNTLTLSLSNFVNFFSYQPQNLLGAIMSNDLLYFHGNGSTTLTTSVPSTISFSHSFSTSQLALPTSLIITNLVSATQAANIARIIINFGSDFDLSSVNCTNSGYTCTNTSNSLTLDVLSAGNLSAISVKNMIAPSSSPSTIISLETYSSSGFLIDQSTTIQWSTACQLPCRTCSSSNTILCNSCYSDLTISQGRNLYQSVNSTCVSVCGDTYYQNYTLSTCQACSTDCYNCVNKTQCLSCVSGKYLLVANTTCYSVCPTGYFQHQTQCLACTSSLNCYTCLNQLSCASCFGSFYFYQLQCLSSCPPNITITNTTTYTCDSCPTNCSTCQLVSSSVVCTSCSSGLLDAGRCVITCQSVGTVPNGNACSACDANCLTCSGAVTFCLTCDAAGTYPYFLLNRCHQNCPATYYNDNNTFSCQPCTQPCQTCSTFSSIVCITCISNYSLFGQVCQSVCPSTYYSNSTTCLPCQPPCFTCFGATLCFSCETNYSLITTNSSCEIVCPDGTVSVNQVCQPCSSNCQTCITQTICLTCPNTTYLYNGTCMSTCPVGYFPNTTLGQCIICHFSCTKCLSLTYCTACQLGYQLQSDFSCLSVCPSHQVPISGICSNCTSSCSGCQQTTTNCTGCISGYNYAPSLFACYLLCPSTLFFSTPTNSCLTACPTASFTTYDSATSVSTCVACPTYCTNCVSSSQCGGCQTGTYLYSSLCYASCPSAAPYAFNFVCQTCNVVDCQTCNGTLCNLCSSGKLLIGSSLCISSCSTNQVYNSVNKTCDTIATSTGGNGTVSSTSATATTGTISFIPLPFFIILVVCSVFIGILHFKGRVSAVPCIFAICGPLLTISNCVVMIVGSVTEAYSTVLAQVGFYFLIIAQISTLVFSIIAIVFWYRKIQPQKYGIAIGSIVHYSIFALMTSNYKEYNSYFIPEHKSFWRKYKLLGKVSLGFIGLYGLGAALLSFGVVDAYSYAFFGGIQICILAFALLVLQCIWIWVPLKEPTPQQIVSSQKSTDNLMASDVDDGERNRQRASEIKTQIDKISQNKDDSRIKSNFEYNQIKGVVKVSHDKIPSALQKGLFRKSQEQILKEEREREEMSHLQSAPKMNKFLEEQKKKQEAEKAIQEEEQEEEQIDEKGGKLKPKVPVQAKPKSKPKPEPQPKPKKKEIKSDSNIFQPDEQEESEAASDEDVNQTTNNIFNNMGKRPQPVQGTLPPTVIQEQDVDSNDLAFDEPYHPKQMDFMHNIIFEQPEEDNITLEEDAESPKQTPVKTVKKDNSLGQLIKKPPKAVRVQTRVEQSPQKLMPVSTLPPKKIHAIQVQDFQDNFVESRFEVFNDNPNKIKPKQKSKQLQRPQPEHKESRTLPQSRKEKLQKEIIHAELQEIMSVEDVDSFQFLQNDDMAYHQSSRRMADHKIFNDSRKKRPVEHEQVDQRPGHLFAKASVNYQPNKETNLPPLQKQQRNNRRTNNKK